MAPQLYACMIDGWGSQGRQKERGCREGGEAEEKLEAQMADCFGAPGGYAVEAPIADVWVEPGRCGFSSDVLYTKAKKTDPEAHQRERALEETGRCWWRKERDYNVAVLVGGPGGWKI